MALRLLQWLRRRRPPEKVTLFVIHPEDMFNVHRYADWTHDCSRCGVNVAIWPSGQEVIRAHRLVEIVCSRCELPPPFAPAAPGALDEIGESQPNPEYRG